MVQCSNPSNRGSFSSSNYKIHPFDAGNDIIFVILCRSQRGLFIYFYVFSVKPPPLRRHLENPMQTLEAMLRPKVATLPGHIQAVYVQNAAKLFATVLKSQEGNTDSTAAQETSQLMIDRLPLFVQSANLEVQERVR